MMYANATMILPERVCTWTSLRTYRPGYPSYSSNAFRSASLISHATPSTCFPGFSRMFAIPPPHTREFPEKVSS
jgi:hypothetical protein